MIIIKITGILKQRNGDFVIFKGNNYNISEKLMRLLHYKVRIEIADKSMILCTCEGLMKAEREHGKIIYFVGGVNITDILINNINNIVSFEAKNITEFDEKGEMV